MKTNSHKYVLLTTGIAVLAFLFIANCSVAPASKNQVNEYEVRAQQEAAQKARGSINLYSDYDGTVLINGEETQFKAIAENEVRITIENAVGNEYTLAVKDSTGAFHYVNKYTVAMVDVGIVHHFSSKILIERYDGRNTKEYDAFILNLSPSPNDPVDFDITQNTNGITITSYKRNRRVVVIPEMLYGQKVTAIGNSAFKEKGIISVTIPNSIVTIGSSSFAGSVFSGKESLSTLNEVVIPDSVTSIGDRAFYKSGLIKVTIGRGVQFIDDGAFNKNKISELIILAPLTTYDRKGPVRRYNEIFRMFYDDYSQTLGLDPGAFGKLESLTRITLPANIHDGNLEAFPEGLVGYYKSQGKRAGTYVLNGPVWARQ